MTLLAYTVSDALRAIGCGRTNLYKVLGTKALPARKMGTRTIILAADLEAYVAALPLFVSKGSKE